MIESYVILSDVSQSPPPCEFYKRILRNTRLEQVFDFFSSALTSSFSVTLGVDIKALSVRSVYLYMGTTLP